MKRKQSGVLFALGGLAIAGVAAAFVFSSSPAPATTDAKREAEALAAVLGSRDWTVTLARQLITEMVNA